MKAYKVVGTFLMKDRWQEFKMEVAADDPRQAREIVLSDLGSRHRVSRKFVNVDRIEEVPEAHVENPVVRWKIGGAK